MYMIKRCVAPLALCLCALPSTAGAACFPVVGSVTLTSDPACTVAGHIPAPGTPGAWVYTGQCFSVRLSVLGFPLGNGYAGVTAEPILGADNTATMTPAVIPVDGQPLPRQIVQTARSAITLGSGSRRTTLYSSDVTVIQPDFSSGQLEPAAVTEQIIITGTDGQGSWANVTGHLTVAGNSIGQPAPLMGKICR